ncbi:hypothetical protein BV898_00322 [Hypsibius exemplaris]|uniref:Uncharacterized protein n=1 Tax=Hypsibius exemplaris TaxID=2072580 RepID=A0A1W0XFF4_HYPEX|nr:hypothetical protein BV898_00322 [Hypsibius exemplaris]
MDSLNGILSDPPPPGGSSSSSEGNLGTLQNVDLPLLLTLLVQNGTISPSEQQQVAPPQQQQQQQESNGSKARQCQTLLQIICSKGMQSMEGFLKIVSLLQQQQHHQLNGGSLGYVSGEVTSSSSSDTVTGSNREDQLSSGSGGSSTQQQQHHHNSSPSAESSSIISTNSSVNLDRRGSQLGNLTTAFAAGCSQLSSTTTTTSSSLQEEISKAIEEKFGAANSCNNLTVRLPPLPSDHQTTDGCAGAGSFGDPKSQMQLLPPIPEFRIPGGFPMKSPKLSNRNVDLNCHNTAGSNGSSMVSQLLAQSMSLQNGNKSSNYLNGGGGCSSSTAGDLIDGPASAMGGGGVAANMNMKDDWRWLDDQETSHFRCSASG